MKKPNTVALEDLVTEVITYFCRHVGDLGFDKCRNIKKYYSGDDKCLWYQYCLTPKQKHKLSDKLLTIMEKEMKNEKETKQ